MPNIHQQTVPAAFAEAVAKYADRPALTGEDGTTLTYAELDAARVRLARALIATGVAHGDSVAIWAPNTVEWAIVGLAIHSVGAAIVPVNTRMRGPEVAYILDRSGATVLFSAGQFLDQYYPDLLADHCPDSVRDIVVLNDARGDDTSLDAFLQRGQDIPPDQVRARAEAVRPKDRMDVMFTSGTTGAPKGVITTHDQNLRMIDTWSQRMAIAADDRYLVVNPFFHSFGYKVGWLVGLLCGATVLPHAVFDAATVMRRIENDRISVLPGPPTLFIGLLEHQGDYDLSTLRATITGAAAVAPTLIERIRSELGFDIVLTGYGLTESCGTVSLCHPEDAAETVVNTVGEPIPGVEVRIVDTETGKPLPANEPGEIVVRGYNVMQGYLDNPEATAKAIDTYGYLHTGDIGMLDDNGYIRITDRLKDMYIVGGFNCYPAEIENQISAHPDVAQVAVIGVPDERMGEIGKAFIVPRHGAQIDTDAMIAWCREQMANYKVPRYIETLAELPTNASGKVIKFELRNNT